MAIQTPWGSDGETFDGADMRNLVAALTGGSSGVVGLGDFAPYASATPDGQINFAPGWAVVPCDDGSRFEVANTSPGAAVGINATGSDPRIDRVLLEVVAGAGQLTVVKGTPGSPATEPSLSGHSQYVELAKVAMPASSSAVTSGTITDRRTRIIPAVSASETFTGTFTAYNSTAATGPGLTTASVSVPSRPYARRVRLLGHVSPVVNGGDTTIHAGWYRGAVAVGAASESVSIPHSSVGWHGTIPVFGEDLLAANTAATYVIGMWTAGFATWQTFSDPTHNDARAWVSAQ